MIPNPLCIYHHDCADGVAAAWAVREYYAGQVDFWPGVYGDAPPDVTGREVVIVDFSYPRDALIEMAAKACRVLVIDHHKTAREELIDLPANVHTLFDTESCGAMIAWANFHTGTMAPLLFDYIQDRDLWRWKVPGSREVTAAIYSHPLTIDTMADLIKTPIPTLLRDGAALVRKQQRDIEAIVRNAVRYIAFGELSVPAANVPWFLASEVAGELAKGQPFAAAYHDDADGRKWSLRSTPEGADVESIARALGGGGHRHAAGFRQTRDEALEVEIMGGFLA